MAAPTIRQTPKRSAQDITSRKEPSSASLKGKVLDSASRYQATKAALPTSQFRLDMTDINTTVAQANGVRNPTQVLTKVVRAAQEAEEMKDQHPYTKSGSTSVA